MVKICKECGKELPNDSVFCQYCGSKNITAQNYIFNTKIVKICNKCKMVLPEDSIFCQYCGSNDIITFQENETIKEKPNISKHKNYDVNEIIVLILLIAFVICMIYLQ